MTESVTEFEVARVDRTVETKTIEVESADGSHYIDQDEPIIHCTGYDEDGKFHHARIEGFRPYFYVPYDEVEGYSGSLVTDFDLYDSDGEPMYSVREERVARAYTQTPGDVSDAKDAFSQGWESDVLYPQRFITDLGIESGIRVPSDHEHRDVHVDEVETCDVDAELRMHVMDIEVDDRHGFPEEGEEPILCITAYDTFESEYVVWIQQHGEDAEYATESQLHDADVDLRWFESERAMLRNYFAYLSGSKPSVIAGWNVDDFDIPYLLDRVDVLNDETDHELGDLYVDAISPVGQAYHSYWGPKVKGVAVFDMLTAFKRRQFTEMASYRLDAVAEEVVGETKETFVGKVGNLWEDDPVKLVDYNLRDVELCVEIDRREELLDFAKELKRFVSCQLSDAIIESTCCDRYLLKTQHGNAVLPRQSSGADEEFSGATVFDPHDGICEWVPMLDLASLYPMSMLTINASPETKVDPAEYDGETVHSPNGIHFRTDKDGITREVIENLLEKRQSKKDARDEHDPSSEMYEVLDRQQTAVKVVMNALYGVMGWSRFRLYDVDAARAVTATGRAVIEHTGSVVEELGHDVLYGDTDSVLLDVSIDEGAGKAEYIALSQGVTERINESYQEFAESQLGADEHWFDIEFEKLFRRYFQAGKKKRYAGHIVWKEGKDLDEVDITGFETRRSDASSLGSRIQTEILKRICHGADEEDVAEYLRQQVDAFDNRDVTLGEIGIPQGIGKDLNDYDRDLHNVRGAKYSNLFLGTSFANGSKPKRYYLDDVNPTFFEAHEESLDPNRDAMLAEFKEDPWILSVERAEELPGDVVLDWEEMREKNIKNPMSNILDSLGLTWDDITTETRQAGLSAFGD